MVSIMSCITDGEILITHRVDGEALAITQELAAAIADVAAEFELAPGKTYADLIHELAEFTIEFLPQALERKKERAAAGK